MELQTQLSKVEVGWKGRNKDGKQAHSSKLRLSKYFLVGFEYQFYKTWVS